MTDYAEKIRAKEDEMASLSSQANGYREALKQTQIKLYQAQGAYLMLQQLEAEQRQEQTRPKPPDEKKPPAKKEGEAQP